MSDYAAMNPTIVLGNVDIERVYNAILSITSALTIVSAIVKSASSAMARGVATMKDFGPENPYSYFLSIYLPTVMIILVTQVLQSKLWSNLEKTLLVRVAKFTC